MKKRDDDRTINEELQKLFDNRAEEIIKADLGTYADLKYFVTFEEKRYLVKLTSKYNLRGNLPDVAREAAAAGIPLNAAVKSRYSPVLKRHCNAYVWLEGKNLAQLLPEITVQEQIEKGRACGKILRRLHEFETKLPVEKVRRPTREFRHYHFYCWLKKIHFPHKEEYDAYFRENRAIWKDRPVKFVHMDFQPKNIMVCEDGFHIIDYENCMFTDPWMDFMCNLVLCPPENENFTIGLLQGYFPKGAPDEFFRVTSLMAVLSLYRYAMWKYQNKGKMVVIQAENVYGLYDGLTNPVPAYLRGKV